MNKRYFILALIAQFCSVQAQLVPIPKGEIKGPYNWSSKIYPGTERNYWLYIPKQYDLLTPACVMVVQDGLSRATDWKLTTALDSLIDAKEIPVTIGIFIDHGKVPSAGQDAYPRFNRSFEYDALGDRYARFLLEEILPEVGRLFNLSKNPNDRLIAGASSGAICAFNVAWERPNEFRRVLSAIGTYVGLRGADELATLIRKTEPKPLRVFLQDGDHDLNIYAGDWWMANQNMLSALTWSGYEVNHSWGTGGHDGKDARTILADALLWVWKDYPKSVQVHKSANQRLDVLLENEPWKEVDVKDTATSQLAINRSGQVFLASRQSIYRLDSIGRLSVAVKLRGEIGGLSFGPDDKLYAADRAQHKIVVINQGISGDVVKNVNPNYVTVSTKGIYFSETSNNRVGFYSFDKKDLHYTTLPGGPTGLALSAEQTFVNVGLANQVFGYSLKILADGNLDFGQDYTHYHIPYGQSFPGTKGMTVDAANILYSATKLGVQASDQLGRVNFIFANPSENPLDVKLGGPGFDTLYLICAKKLYYRKINTKGVLSWLPAVKPPQPRM